MAAAVLTGALVILRAPSADDRSVLYEIEADLDSWEQRTGRPPRPTTRARFEQSFTKSLAEDAAGVSFVIEADGTAVGKCDLFHFDELARSAEIGIALHPSARGRGYGTDALRVTVRFGFQRRNLHRIYLSALASNLAAIAAYRKVGFVEEGRLRQSAWVDGGFQDELRMAVLRPEWAP